MTASHLLHLVAVQADETRDLHLLASSNVDDVVAAFEGTLVDTNIGELTKPASLKEGDYVKEEREEWRKEEREGGRREG